jgi:hypothetical protein
MDADPAVQTLKTVLAAYRDNNGSLEEVGCNLRFWPEGRIESRLVWRTDGASTYYVMGGAYQSVPMGVLRLNFSPTSIPENDALDAAAAISTTDPFPMIQPAHSATGAISDPAFGTCPPYSASLWFAVSEPAGTPLAFTTEGSDYNTVAGVFKKDPNGVLTPVACNNDEMPGKTTSRVTWQSDGGDYFVVVGALTGFSGGLLRSRLTSP